MYFLMLLPHLILLTIAALVIYAIFWRPSPIAAAIAGVLAASLLMNIASAATPAQVLEAATNEPSIAGAFFVGVVVGASGMALLVAGLYWFADWLERRS